MLIPLGAVSGYEQGGIACVSIGRVRGGCHFEAFDLVLYAMPETRSTLLADAM